MDKEAFIKDWKKFLIDIDKTEKEIAEETNQKQQNLNRKIKDGTIKYLELSEIVEKYGYSIQLHSKYTEEELNIMRYAPQMKEVFDKKRK